MEIYEEWDMTIPPIPPRSRLYRLEPIGIGTPYIESLTSYIARLAQAHCVAPKYLVTKEILPLQGQIDATSNYYSRLNKLWSRDAFYLNGFNLNVVRWIETLKALTTCDNLHLLTMLTWREVISLDRLLHPNKFWCPLCFEEWKRTQQFIYEPLLWMLKGINICIKHLKPLVMQCPYCLKSLPHLTRSTRPGYCAYCKCWLGNSVEAQPMEYSNLDLEKQIWITKGVGELLTVASEMSNSPTKDQIGVKINHLKNKYTRGDLSALSRLLKMTNKGLLFYIQGKRVPCFETVLDICFNLSISPLDFFTTNSVSSNGSYSRIEHLTTMRQGRNISKDEAQYIRQTLEALVSEEINPFPTLEEIARRLGRKAKTLKRHFPELCNIIIVRGRRNIINNEDLGSMKQVLENALTASEPMPLTPLASQLGFSIASFYSHFPDLCQAIVKRYRGRHKYEQAKQLLEDVLAKEEKAPSPKELAHRLGYKYQTLRRHFPEYCKQITERRNAEVRKQHEERFKNRCTKISDAMRTLHRQGIYPSRPRVGVLLKRKDLIHFMYLEGYEIWKDALKELGYVEGNNEKRE